MVMSLVFCEKCQKSLGICDFVVQLCIGEIDEYFCSISHAVEYLEDFKLKKAKSYVVYFAEKGFEETWDGEDEDVMEFANEIYIDHDEFKTKEEILEKIKEVRDEK